ncbi:MAG TPA: hypothetical protein VNU25_02310 [Candidatus Paceibacterota bacterium]|nr:hypothetical protein [Candidatus Paceibacterota bacterium]
MMMHDEGTGIYDMLIAGIAERPVELVLIAAALFSGLIVLAFIAETVADLARREREQNRRDEEAVLDLKHSGQWPIR